MGSGDAPEIMQLVFQQFKSYIYLEVPQLQFIDRVLDLSVVPQRIVRTMQTVQKTGDSTGAVILEVVCNAR